LIPALSIARSKPPMPANSETPVFIIDSPLVYSCVRVIGVEPIRFPYGPRPTRLPRVKPHPRMVTLCWLCSKLRKERDNFWRQSIGCDHLLWF
jgi:hypothetical protein